MFPGTLNHMERAKGEKVPSPASARPPTRADRDLVSFGVHLSLCGREGGGQACASFLHMTPRSQHQSPGHMEATKSVGTGLSQTPAIYPHPEGRSQLLKHLHLGTPMPPPPPPENDFGLSLHKCKQNHKPSFKTGFPGLISSKNSNFFVNQAFK